MPHSKPVVDHNTVALSLAQRLRRIIRLPHLNAWQLWLDTADYIHGTYLVLYDDGTIERVTSRAGEGDDVQLVRPSDRTIYKETA